MFRLGCVTILVLLFAIPAIASRYLPWWGVPVVLVGEVLVLAKLGPALFKYGVKRFAMGLFLTKSRVLRGASVQVHEVRPTTRPVTRRPPEELESTDAPARTEITAADGSIITMPQGHDDEDDVEEESANVSDGDEDDDEDQAAADLRYVLVDFTITPAAGASKMQHYEPGELMLVPADAKVRMTEDPTTDGVTASAIKVTLVDENGAEDDSVAKITGPAHLRAVFGCSPALHERVKFRYYFEVFGELTLPA